MSDLSVVAFKDEATAFELRAELVRLQKEYLLQMEDSKSAEKQLGSLLKPTQTLGLAADQLGGGRK